MSKRKRRLGSHPIVNGVAAVVSVLAGALASFFTGSIRSFIGLPTDPDDGTHFAVSNIHWSWDGAAFFVLVAVAAALFAWSKSADSASENEQQAELDGVLRNIESMPPDTFLGAMQDQYRVAHFAATATMQAFSEAPAAVTTQDVDQAIRSVLMAIARSARAYDAVSVRTYQANLMLYVEGQPTDKLARVLDVEHLATGSISGYLEAFRSLAVSTSGTDEPVSKPVAPAQTAVAQPDDHLVEIALAVHKKDGAAGNLLPGAPRAFNEGRAMHCPSIDELLLEMDTGYKDKNQADALRKYFKTGAGKEISSFISIPIPTATKEVIGHTTGVTNAYVGVMNLQSSDPNILRTGSKLFWPVIYPFTLLLADLISIRRTVSLAVTTTLSADTSTTGQ